MSIKAENIADQVFNSTTLENATQFTRNQLEEVREHLKAKREGLLDAKGKTRDGQIQAELNVELSVVKTTLSKTNQAISMLDVNAKQQKQHTNQVKGGFAQLFLKTAEKELDAKTFERIKNKALKAA
jgi:flagellar biosynthesis chaperone FliJ